jgi:hypothetical protein
VPHQRSGVDIPKNGDVVTRQISLGRFSGTPIRSHNGKFAHHQRFNVGSLGFLVVQIRPDVADVRICQADDLPGVAGIGEYFLVSGETRIKNDFAATADPSARRTTAK